jgi:hypothetical protein
MVTGRAAKIPAAKRRPRQGGSIAWADAEPGAPLDADFRQFADRSVIVHIAPRGSTTVQVKAN